MKITEKQLYVLYETTKESLRIASPAYFSFSHETRLKIVNEVLSQMSEKLMDVENEKI